MKLELIVHFGDPGIVAEILSLLKSLVSEGKKMSQQLDALKAQVAETTTVAASAVQLIGGLAAQIEALKDDPAALQALVDELKATDTSLAAAITANTPPPAPPAV